MGTAFIGHYKNSPACKLSWCPNYPQHVHNWFFTFCKRSARSFVQFHTCGCSGYYASADDLSQCVVYSICKYCLFYKSLHAVTFELCGDLIICHHVSILR